MVNCSIHWCYWDEELRQQMSLLIFWNNYRNWCCCEGHKQAITEPLAVCGGSDWKIACDALFRADIWSWKLTQTFNSSALFKGCCSFLWFFSFHTHHLKEEVVCTPCQVGAMRSKNWELMSEGLCEQADHRTCSGSSEYGVSWLENRHHETEWLFCNTVFWQ